MKKLGFEQMLREAVLADVEEQGQNRFSECNLEPASNASRERFLAGMEVQRRRKARRIFWRRFAISVGTALFTLALTIVIVRAVIRNERTVTIIDSVPAESFAPLDSNRKHVVRIMVTAGTNYVEDLTYAREDGDFDFSSMMREFHVQWKKDRCILTYSESFAAQTYEFERVLPYGESVSVGFEAYPYPVRCRFLLCYADDPLPEDWEKILAEENRIEAAQRVYRTFDAFYASRDAEKEIGIIEQAKHDATENLPTEIFYLAFLHALWKNGYTDVQIVRASTGYDPYDRFYSHWLIITGSDGKSYKVLGSAYEAGDVYCDGVLIYFR